MFDPLGDGFGPGAARRVGRVSRTTHAAPCVGLCSDKFCFGAGRWERPKWWRLFVQFPGATTGKRQGSVICNLCIPGECCFNSFPLIGSESGFARMNVVRDVNNCWKRTVC